MPNSTVPAAAKGLPCPVKLLLETADRFIEQNDLSGGIRTQAEFCAIQDTITSVTDTAEALRARSLDGALFQVALTSFKLTSLTDELNERPDNDSVEILRWVQRTLYSIALAVEQAMGIKPEGPLGGHGAIENYMARELNPHKLTKEAA